MATVRATLLMLLLFPWPLAAEGTEVLSTSGAVRVGSPAPRFGGTFTDGTVQTLDGLLHQARKAGRCPLVLTFFATWCEGCKVGLALLDQANAGVAPGRPLVVGVAVGEDREVVASFFSREGLRFLAFADRFMPVATLYGVVDDGKARLPRTFVLRLDGTVATMWGAEGDDLAALLEQERTKCPLPDGVAPTAPGP